MQKVLPLKRTKIAIALMSSAMILACSGDFEPSSRIIQEGDNGPNPPVAPQTVTSQFDIAGASLDYFDLQDGQNVASSTYVASNTPASTSATTAEVELKAGADSPTGLLVVLTVPEGTKYFDPISRQSTELTEDKKLYAVSSSSALNLSPTPFTTLALYRTLARIGWFYDHTDLPTATELAQIVNENRDDFFLQYNDAKRELADVFLLPDFQANLKIYENYSQTADENTNNAAVYNYAALTAQLRVYADTFNSVAPFFDVAADLSTDFFDGDIDGKTLRGVLPVPSTTLVTSNSNQGIIFNPNAEDLFEEIYLNQNGTLQNFETLVSAEIPSLITELSLNTATANRLTSFFDPTDISESPSDEAGMVQSYADYSQATFGPFKGVGDKTFGFGLPAVANGLAQKAFLGLPQSTVTLSPLSTVIVEVQQAYGRYSNSNNCKLTFGANGVIELVSGSTQYKALLDRDANDTLFELSAGDYRLNAATAIESGSNTNRVIQLDVSAGVVLSARTALVTQVGSGELPAPELSCDF